MSGESKQTGRLYLTVQPARRGGPFLRPPRTFFEVEHVEQIVESLLRSPCEALGDLIGRETWHAARLKLAPTLGLAASAYDSVYLTMRVRARRYYVCGPVDRRFQVAMVRADSNVDSSLDMQGSANTNAGALINAVGYDLLPPGLPYLEQFRMAADAGFRALEMPTVADSEGASEVKEAADSTGLRIHSVLASLDRRSAFYSGDAREIEANVEAALISVANAALWGADVVLLIPGLIDAQTSFEQAHARSRRAIRERILPVAAAHQVTLGIENVWHGCLLGPLEYVRYIDDFESPWVRAYLDVGNMVLGFPEHWVRVCGHRIVRLHIKDFRMRRELGRFYFAKVGAGGIDWVRVRAALGDVGFAGPVTNTAVPFGPVLHWCNRVSRAVRRRYGGRSVNAALCAASRWQKPMYARFLKDVSSRFQRFDDLRPLITDGRNQTTEGE